MRPWIFLWVPTTLGGIREVGGIIQGDGIGYMRTAHFVE